MKKILIVLMLIACFASTAYGLQYGEAFYKKHIGDALQKGQNDPILRFIREVEAGLWPPLGTGKVWYVDSNVTNEGDGSTLLKAFDTLDEAINACGTDSGADRGDRIYVAQGHAESGSVADLWDADVAGITIWHLGNGSNQATYTFAASDTTVSIGAANVTIIGGRLLAGVDEVAIGMDVTAAADYLTVIGMEFPEPGTSGFEFNIAVQLVTGADDVTFIGCKAYSADSAGADHWLNGGDSIVNRLTLINNTVIGEFAIAPIFSDQADLECYIAYNTVTNMTSAQDGIEFSGNATGSMHHNLVSTNAIGTSIDPGRMADYGNLWDDFATYDTTAVPWTTNETGVNRWGATELAQMEGEATGALEADHIDHLFAVSVADEIATDSWAADICASDGDWSGFDKTTDSLEAIRDKIDVLTGIGFRGTVTSNATTTEVPCVELAGFGNDYFNTGWSMICILDADDKGDAPEGEIIDITDYVSTTGHFTLNIAFSSALTTGDEIYVRRVEELNLDDPTMLGASGNIWYIDSGTSGDGSGTTWENAFASITAAKAGNMVASNGDVAYLAAGHSETISAALSLAEAGISYIGLGEGSEQATVTLDSTTSTQIDITVANILFENIKFVADLADLVICLDLAAGADGTHVKKCRFVSTADSTKEFLSCITLASGTDDVLIEESEFISVGGDADVAVQSIAGPVDNLQIINCWLKGDYDNAPIYSNQINTSALVKGNVVHQERSGGYAIEFSTTMTGDLVGNKLYSNSYATMLDPGDMIPIDNWGTDAADEQAIRIPLSAETTDVLEAANGSNLERLEYLQNKSDDILARLRAAGGTIGNVFYVDDATGAAEGGTSWELAEATMDGAHDECTADSGDIIFLAPDHEEIITTGLPLTWATAGVTVIGIGEGEQQPMVTFSGINSSINVNAASYVFENIRFHSSTTDTTIGIDIKDAGDDCIIRKCLFTNDSGFEFIDAVELNDNADRVTIEYCEFINTGGVDARTAIRSTQGTVDRMKIVGNYIFGAYDHAGIYSDDIDTLCLIKDNIVHNNQAGIHAIEFDTTASGDCINNKMFTDAEGTSLDPGSMACFENYVCTAVDQTAVLVPATSGVSRWVSKAQTTVHSDSTNPNLFDVDGGPILIKNFFGRVTTNIGATTTTMEIALDADSPWTNYDFSTAVAITGDAAGTRYVFESQVVGGTESVLTPCEGADTGATSLFNSWLCGEGMIEAMPSTADNDGAITWYMEYIPLEPGVTVTAQ